MDANQIEQLIRQHLPGADVSVTSPDNVHFSARVVSEQFRGLNRIAQHRLVHAALGEDLGEAIHALSLVTQTPAAADQGAQ